MAMFSIAVKCSTVTSFQAR